MTSPVESRCSCRGGTTRDQSTASSTRSPIVPEQPCGKGEQFCACLRGVSASIVKSASSRRLPNHLRARRDPRPESRAEEIRRRACSLGSAGNARLDRALPGAPPPGKPDHTQRGLRRREPRPRPSPHRPMSTKRLESGPTVRGRTERSQTPIAVELPFSDNRRPCGCDDVRGLDQRQLLEIGSVGQRHVHVGHAQHRRIEVVEAFCHATAMISRRNRAGRPPSSTTTMRLVRFRLSSTVALSSGRSVRRSMTSASMPSPSAHALLRAQRRPRSNS